VPKKIILSKNLTVTLHKGIMKCFRESSKWGMSSYYGVKDGKISSKTNNFIFSLVTRKNFKLFEVCRLAIFSVKTVSNRS